MRKAAVAVLVCLMASLSFPFTTFAKVDEWEGVVKASVIADGSRLESDMKGELDTLMRASAANKVGQLVVKQEIYEQGEFRETVNALSYASVMLKEKKYSYQKEGPVTYLRATAVASARTADLEQLFSVVTEHSDIMALASRVLDASSKLAAYDGLGSNDAIYQRFGDVVGVIAPRNTIEYWRIKKDLQSADMVARMVLALNRVADLNASQPIEITDIGGTSVKGHPHIKVALAIGKKRDHERWIKAWSYFVDTELPVECSPADSLYVKGATPNPKILGCRVASQLSEDELRRISRMVAGTRVVVTGSTWRASKDTCTMNEYNTFLLRESEWLVFPPEEKGPFKIRIEKTPVPGRDACFNNGYERMEIGRKQELHKLSH